MIKCYILIKDLPSMTPGKACAQTHHAATSMMWTLGDKAVIGEGVDTPYNRKARKWLGDLGVGTTICLRVTPEEFDWCKEHMSCSHWGIYEDETYPITINGKPHTIPMETCIWALAGKKEQEFFKKFPLY